MTISAKGWKRILLAIAVIIGSVVHLILLLIQTPFLRFEPWDARFCLIWAEQWLAYAVFCTLIWHAAKAEVK